MVVIFGDVETPLHDEAVIVSIVETTTNVITDVTDLRTQLCRLRPDWIPRDA